MANDQELPDHVHQQIQKLCAEGDALSEAKNYEQAVARYNEAWTLVPEPKANWNASTWIMAAIGDACYLGGFMTSAFDALSYSMHCPGGLGNPFLHLRLGEVLFERGEHDQAADELARAYMGGGEEIFANENAKYRAFLAARMKLPAA